ncbi:MAG TPA: stage III sporulation protein AF [Tepidimicrobium sp.]|nr:stage III sporulation protein AF [Tepidimicrobium sp.]
MGIVDFLTLWVKDIVIVFVLISIMGIIIPNSSMKRYIDMIIGFLIIIVIIAPIVKLVHRNFAVDKVPLWDSKIQTEFEHDDRLDKIQKQQMESIYVGKIEGEIAELIHENTEYEIVELRLSICEDGERYGGIEQLEIDLQRSQGQEQISKGVILVDNIDSISIGDERETNSTMVEIKDDKIREAISSRYDIAKEDIKMFLNTSGEDGLNEKDSRSN